MSKTPDIWYWTACILFSLVSGLIIYLLRRHDKKMEEVVTKTAELGDAVSSIDRNYTGLVSACAERHRAIADRHKAIDESLKIGRTRFRGLEEIIKVDISTVNTSVTKLATLVGELKGELSGIRRKEGG